jgi:multiple sugar transport system ATP-binding protein
MPRVSFENIVKRFGSLTVLDDLNLTVEDGEFLVLLGPSGCGKTTLLNLLAGLLDVSSGRIMIDARDVTLLDPKDRGLAMVFQSYALYPTKTVDGNLRFGLASQRMNRDQVNKRVKWAAQLLQIENLLNRKPSQLSGGQRQRVAIGRALVKYSGVLLFDEPLSNLDAKLRTEMRLEIKKLHTELKQTVVYVTHDQIEAMTMASRVAIMDRGVIQQIGTPDEVYERPANLFVAKFIGAPAINIFEACIAMSGGRVVGEHAETGTVFDLSRYSFAEAATPGMLIAVGVRPENFVFENRKGASTVATVRLPLRYGERTGSDATLFLDAGKQLIAVRTEPSRIGALQPGETVELNVVSDGIGVFDARTGQRM